MDPNVFNTKQMCEAEDPGGKWMETIFLRSEAIIIKGQGSPTVSDFKEHMIEQLNLDDVVVHVADLRDDDILDKLVRFTIPQTPSSTVAGYAVRPESLKLIGSELSDGTKVLINSAMTKYEEPPTSGGR